jgi:hypothetical protein
MMLLPFLATLLRCPLSGGTVTPSPGTQHTESYHAEAAARAGAPQILTTSVELREIHQEHHQAFFSDVNATEERERKERRELARVQVRRIVMPLPIE